MSVREHPHFPGTALSLVDGCSPIDTDPQMAFLGCGHHEVAGLQTHEFRHKVLGAYQCFACGSDASGLNRARMCGEIGKQGRRRTMINTPLRKSIAVRTFGDWHNPSPGFFEMDMVVHCGKSTVGSYVHSLVLTDIASGPKRYSDPSIAQDQAVAA